MSESVNSFLLPQGFYDVLPEEQEYFTYIKKVVRHRSRQSGFRRISTSIFERKALLEKIYGSTADFFCVQDRDGNELCLKPEGRIGIGRAYVQHKMFEWPQPVELYYIEPHIRYRDASRKPRQLFEFGVEIIGEGEAAIVAQVVQLAHKILKDLGVAELLSLEINSMGCVKCRAQYLQDLQNHYVGKERFMCQECVNHLNQGQSLNILLCQKEDCQILSELGPKIGLYLCEECKNFHRDFQELLKTMDIPYRYNELVVRIPYYDGTVFDFRDKDDKKKKSICWGGRHDHLIETLGGPPISGVGFNMRVAEIIDLMQAENIKVPSKDDLHVFVAQLGKEAKKVCLSLMDELREAGIKTVGTVGKGSMREQLDLATKFKVPYMVLIGITEVRDGTVILREMKRGSQQIVAMNQVASELIKALGEQKLDMYSPGEVLY